MIGCMNMKWTANARLMRREKEKQMEKNNENAVAVEPLVSLTKIRMMAIRAVREAKYFPDTMKGEAVDIVNAHFNLMSLELAAIELAHRRPKS